VLNLEQARLNTCKEELKDKSDEELKEIANAKVRTAFFFDNKQKLYQMAAYQLLRERAIS